jgi:dihydropteroate synthase type 2
VNLSEDSFSVGGRHVDPDRAVAHARTLVRDGADAIDLGAAASNPDAAPVSADEEIRRLTPVVDALERDHVPISIDSFQPAVQTWALSRRVALLNDTRGFPEESLYPRLSAGRSRLVVMHAVQQKGKADRTDGNATVIYDRVVSFFQRRLAALEAGGVARARCILDPGMGFFLGAGIAPSIAVLRKLGELRAAFELPVLVSVSRKSFLGALTGRTADERGAATLAAELYAVRQGADWIRTHDVRALRDALVVAEALEGGR